MGGRGALSGIGEKLPTAFNPPLGAWQLPTLSGTEKQVNWAEKIREQVLNEIEAYTSTRNSDGRMSRLYDVYYYARLDTRLSMLLSDGYFYFSGTHALMGAMQLTDPLAGTGTIFTVLVYLYESDFLMGLAAYVFYDSARFA